MRIARAAADALLDNLASHAWHRAIGCAEAGCVVYFRRPIEEALA